MARDDWRIRIELEEEGAGGLLERFGVGLSSRARELAQELTEDRLAVTRDGDTIFVYASSGPQADRAQKVVEAELEEAGVSPITVHVEHWLAEEERWDDEPRAAGWEEETLEHGYAPWEVRIECASHEEATALADRLEAEGHAVVRRWRYAIIGTASREEAEKLAQTLHGTVEPGGELVWEVLPKNPFAVFGGLGG